MLVEGQSTFTGPRSAVNTHFRFITGVNVQLQLRFFLITEANLPRYLLLCVRNLIQFLQLELSPVQFLIVFFSRVLFVLIS